MMTADPSSERIRLFKNEHLEKFTLISPRVFVLSWAVMLPLIAWTGLGAVTASVGAGLVLAGLFAWSLFEYGMHRYLFHLDLDHPRMKRWVFVIHGNHHHSSNDPLRDIMPLSVSIPIMGSAWLVCLALLGPPGTWVFLGFNLGYVTYDIVHYACHQWPMRGRLGAAVKRHHMRHHFVTDHGNYAITALFWDSVFETRLLSTRRDRALA